MNAGGCFAMKILVLNQDLDERMIIQQILLHNGHEIVSAETSEVAIQLLQEGDIRFVIADRVTTDVDEKQFMKSIRDANPPFYIYILVLTAKLQEADIMAPPTEADDTMLKPIVPTELKSRVHLGARILGL